MPLCGFADNYAMYDVTPVDNLFLLEFMPYAPGDYVRVYLYGLMQCRYPAEDASVESVAGALGLKPEQVLEAFRYWEQKGLLIGLRDNPPAFQYVSLREAMVSGREVDAKAYRYQRFTNDLQSIFGAERLLHPQEYQKAMEWVDELRIPEEVVLLLARRRLEEAKLKGRSVKYLFKELDKSALQMAKESVRTVEDAEWFLSRESDGYKTAQKVLRGFNQSRRPTQAEVDAANKWLFDWHFDEEAILRAQRETTRSANPSFAYLEGILQNLKGASTDAAGADAELNRRGARLEAVKKLLEALGTKGQTPTPAQLEIYDGWIAARLPLPVLEKAAALCGLEGRRSFEDLKNLLDYWQTHNIRTPENVEDYIQNRETAKRLLQKCASRKRPSFADVEQVALWRAQFPIEVLDFAAECARGMTLPFKYMERLLGEWSTRGIKDLEAARAEKQAHAAANPGGKPKEPLPGQQFPQREYDNEKLAYLAVDWATMPEGEDGK